ncbi:MAG: hypothetical protein LBJ38_01950 [Oscillospiraceae bacterium]|nr:hypothetical protein [Oscillospiraceae bacterium]
MRGDVLFDFIWGGAKNTFGWVKNQFWNLFSGITSKGMDIQNKLNPIDKISGKFATLKDSLFSLKKPNGFRDYYRLGTYLISKSVGKLLLVVVVLLCLWYVAVVTLPQLYLRMKFGKNPSAKECYYDANSLKNYTGQVKVFSRKSQAVYEGGLVAGVAGGLGALYDSNGCVLYRGEFKNNRFNGVGTLYYENDQVKFEGDFLDNLFTGSGSLYAEDGKLMYVGGFVNGKKNGMGTLCDETGAEVYKGRFCNDLPDLSSYLGFDIAALKDVFVGRQVIYNCGDIRLLISCPDVDAVIAIDRDADSTGSVYKIFIVAPSFYPGTIAAFDRLKLSNCLKGNFVDGLTKVTVEEMCVIDAMRASGVNKFKGYEQLQKEKVLDNVFTVNEQTSQDDCYISKYKIGQFIYTFYFEALDKPYVFFSVERLS